MTAKEAENQREFAARQEHHAKELASQQSEREKEAGNVKDTNAKLDKAAQHRADVERRNAQRDKPRGAPLPP
jgi:hypothetical protein